MAWQSFNVNERVRVKLTDIGKAELQRQHDELVRFYPKANFGSAYHIDGDGWTSLPMWDLMKCLGHLCGMGLPVPFETVIEIERAASTVTGAP